MVQVFAILRIGMLGSEKGGTSRREPSKNTLPAIGQHTSHASLFTIVHSQCPLQATAPGTRNGIPVPNKTDTTHRPHCTHQPTHG